MKHLAWLAVIAAGCTRMPASAAISHDHHPTPVPAGWTALRGPFADPVAQCAAEDRCRLEGRRDIAAGDIRGVAMLSRGDQSVLVVETRLGWFSERLSEVVLHRSHHEPHSAWLDADHARADGDTVILRNVDAQSVFYPGQGPVGWSATTWYERSCRVIDAVVHCSGAARIAEERCKTERVPGPSGPDGPPFHRTCTGGEPRSAMHAAVVADDSDG